MCISQSTEQGQYPEMGQVKQCLTVSTYKRAYLRAYQSKSFPIDCQLVCFKRTTDMLWKFGAQKLKIDEVKHFWGLWLCF